MLFNLSGQGYRLPFYSPDDFGGGGTAGDVTPNQSIDTNGQANVQPNVSSQTSSNQSQGETFTNLDPTKLPPEVQPFYKNMLADYTRKTMEVAPLRKLAEETGMTVDQIREQLNYATSITKDPKAAVKEYLAQDQAALLELLRENPMQAAQIMGQVFNNGQAPNANPYAKYADYDNIPDLLKAYDADNMSKFEKLLESRLGPVVQPIQQQFQAQRETAIKSQANGRIDEFIKAYPQAGITQEAVWETVKKIGVPLSTIETQPWLIDSLMIESIGGQNEFAKRISNQSVQQYQKQVQSNATSTAQLTPTGGIPAVMGNVPSQDAGKIKSEMHRMFDVMQNANKT